MIRGNIMKSEREKYLVKDLEVCFMPHSVNMEALKSNEAERLSKMGQLEEYSVKGLEREF